MLNFGSFPDGYYDASGSWLRTKLCFVYCGARCTCSPPNGLWQLPTMPTTNELPKRTMLCYDPRFDTSPGANPDDQRFHVETRNPALIMAKYAGASYDASAWARVAEQANFCDEPVTSENAGGVGMETGRRDLVKESHERAPTHRLPVREGRMVIPPTMFSPGDSLVIYRGGRVAIQRGGFVLAWCEPQEPL